MIVRAVRRDLQVRYFTAVSLSTEDTCVNLRDPEGMLVTLPHSEYQHIEVRSDSGNLMAPDDDAELAAWRRWQAQGKGRRPEPTPAGRETEEEMPPFAWDLFNLFSESQESNGVLFSRRLKVAKAMHAAMLACRV